MEVNRFIKIFSIFFIFLFACKHEAIIPDDYDPNALIEDEFCDSNVVYFEQQVLPILLSTCAVPECHDAAKASTKNVVLTSYISLINSSEAWDDADPLKTDFWDVIFDGDMPLPSSGKELSNEQKDLIREWLAQGAKNNSCKTESCDTTNVTYNNQIVKIIESHCKGCHSGTNPQVGVSLIDYTSVKNIAEFQVDSSSLLFGVVNHSDGFVKMPYNQSKLSDCKITAIKKWIDGGMPQ